LIAGETYKLVEITAPDGYQLSKEEVTFTVKEDGTVTPTPVVMYNTEKGKLVISKKAVSSTDELLGAKLQILDKNNKVVDEWTSGEDTNDEGNAIAHEVSLDDGQYTLIETAAPAGYLIATEIAFEVSGGKAYRMIDGKKTDVGGMITMEDQPIEVTINKTAFGGDGTTVVSGASMKLTAKDADTNLSNIAVEGKILPQEADNILAWTSTGTDTLSALPAGEYTLEETLAPDGYKLPVVSTFTFTVNADGTVTTKESTTTGAFTLDGTTITVADDISKIQIGKKDVSGKQEVAGATLELYSVTKNADEETETFIEKWVSETGKVWTISGLLNGTYILKETGGDFEFDGDTYTVISSELKFTITNGEIASVEGAKSAYQADATEGFYYYNAGDEETGKNMIVVADAVKPEETTTTTETTTSETTTSETTTSETTTSETTTSETTTSETTTSETTTSESTTSETTTSETTTSETTTSETTTSGTTTTIIITVQDVVIAKKDITGKTEVKGAKLQVIDQKSGDEVDSWTSDDSDHTIAGEKFTIGETYVLKETGAPDGYAYAADITFTINEDGTIQVDASNLDDNGTIVMKDDVTRVSITKVELVVSGDGTETKELPGAELELYYVTQNEAGETTETLVDSWTSTNEAHEINGELIAGGTYKLVETQAPNGYQIAEAVTFTVNMDGTVKNVIMTDAAEGQIVISKQSINGTEELAGATLKITNSKGQTIKTWVSKETAEIVQLDAGEYTLTEETAPNGYVVAESIQFTVDKNGKVTVNGTDAGGIIIMKDDTTKVSISKTDITGDKEVPGAKLEITDKEGNVVEEWTSTTEKHLIEGKLTAGETYTLKETGAPDGYAYAEEIQFTIDESGKVVADASNLDENGMIVMKDDVTKVSISKQDITGDKEVPGATLQILDKNGEVVEEWTSTDQPHEIEGKLNAGETYTLKETNAPNGYAYAEDVTFTVNEDNSVTEVVMKDDVTKVSISKKTLTGSEELAGAELEVLDKDGKTVDSWTSTDKPHEINGTLIAGETYTLVEITAPDGYQVAEAVTFTVNKDGTVTEVTMRDAAEGEIAISKQSINGTEELEGATLKITDATGKTIEEWVSGQTAKVVQLEAGEYTLTEETAPDGYVVAESITFIVDKTGKVTVNGKDVGGIITMKDNTTKVSISKQNITGSKEVAGATLQILDKNGEVVEEWVSTTDVHLIEGKLIAGETYTLKETNAPNGYAYAEEISFTVGTDGKTQMVVMQDETTKVSISKQDMTTGEELAGAELALYDADNQLIASWTSTEQPHYIEGELIAGATYRLVETTAPDGYLVAESIDFVMEDSRIYVYVNEDGIVRKKEVSDLLVVMVDQYAPVTTTETEETTTTETETTTTTTETVTETDETTTTTTKRDAGNDTLTTTTTTTTETETETETTTTTTETETETTTTTTDTSSTTSSSGSSTQPATTTSKTTTTKKSSSSSSSGSSSGGSTGTTPKTGDRALPIFITGGAAFLLAAASKPKRKNKKV